MWKLVDTHSTFNCKMELFASSHSLGKTTQVLFSLQARSLYSPTVPTGRGDPVGRTAPWGRGGGGCGGRIEGVETQSSGKSERCKPETSWFQG